jgi:hypothetical protein
MRTASSFEDDIPTKLSGPAVKTACGIVMLLARLAKRTLV